MRPRRRRNERGIAMPLTAVASVLLLICAAIAVDISAWWVQTAQVQRAADNAALAGVIWLPDQAKAFAMARANAAKNGFTDGDNATVGVERVKGNQLRVTIDTAGRLYFGRAFAKGVGLRRAATAQYSLGVPLGSPESALGMNDVTIGTFGPQKYWLAVNSYCMGREQGDLMSARYQANRDTATVMDRCPPAAPASVTPNANYNDRGYVFVVDVPHNSTSIAVEVYDPGECNPFFPPTTLDWELYSADTTPTDDSDNPLIASASTPPTDRCNDFRTLFTIPSGATPGQWLIRVRSLADDLPGGFNRFGLWARRPADTQPCSTLTDAACPKLYARDRLPMLVWGASDPTFYLAEIAPDNGGKRMDVSLFDSAEGMQYLQLLDPNGTPVSFTWSTVDGGYPSTPSTSCDTGPCLRVDGTGPTLVNGQCCDQFGTTASPQDMFNNREVVLSVTLPDAATMAAYPNNWWSLRYVPKSGAMATDRTTWSVSLRGEPVRLVD